VCVSVTSHTLPHWAVAHTLQVCGCSLSYYIQHQSVSVLYHVQQQGDIQFEAFMAAEFNEIFLGQWLR
jgi:hypothetical protein